MASQATAAEVVEDADPYSNCDEVEFILSKVNITVMALKKFCLENRNVHL